jgi:hypothetical protein
MTVDPHTMLVCFRALGRLFPPTPLDRVTSLTLAQLRAKYKWREPLTCLFGVFVFIGLAIGYYLLLDAAAVRYYRGFAGAPYLIRPAIGEFGVGAALLSVISAGYVVVVAHRFLLGAREYGIYLAYINNQFVVPVDFAKMFRWECAIGMPLLLALAIFRIDHYSVFTNQKIIENSFFSLGVENVHSYSEVQAVYEVRGYHARFYDVEAPYHLIRFTDGTTWESEQESKEAKLGYQRSIAYFVAEKSGTSLQHVAFREDIPR